MRRRFRHERQILAAIDHPNIAKLLDGGTTGDGRPYLVMDYVEGEPLTTYCDQHRLSTNERLKLFLSVCSAVSYAHQNLVIHRDLKAANVLVTSEGVPKLLDFGIAKLLKADAVIDEAHTVTQLGVMTPEYASPEQVRGEQVTTATDVYSLGVLLYELLTGHRPYRIKSHRSDEVMRVICEHQPTRPSAAVSTVEVISNEDQTKQTITPEAVSEVRDQSSDKLRRSLSGDLDNIVLMALRKEPQRRYASVAQFADDIRRHMDGLPVAARVDTVWYRTSKFVGRHKLGVAAAAIVLLTLAAGLTVAMWQAKVASQQRDRARIQQAKAEHINAFMQQMFASADPSRKGRDVKVAEVLDEATAKMEAELADQPEVLAEVRRTIGNTYRSLGLYDQAEPHLRFALEKNKQLYGDQDAATIKSISDLAYLLRFKGALTEAESLYRRALELHRTQTPAGSSEMAETSILFAELLIQKGETKASLPFAQQALEMSTKFLGPGNDIEARSLNCLGLEREYEGDLSGAEQFYRRAIDSFAKLPGRPRFEMGATLMNLGTNLTTQQKYAEAEGKLLESVRVLREVLGDSHSLYGNSLVHLGRLYLLKGDYAKAEEATRQAIQIQERTLPKGHLDFGQSVSLLGLILTRAGNPVKGESYLREALEIRRKGLPAGHWLTANTRSQLGECLMAQKRYAEAEPLLMEGYEGLKNVLGEKHPRTTEAIQRLVYFCVATKKVEEAAHYRAMLPG
jgi:serine/threonine-protein kinase